MDTAFSVNVTAGQLRAGQILIIDQEGINIVQVNGSNITMAIRGYSGNQASHTAGTTVVEKDPTHLNKKGYAIVAQTVAAKLGSGSSQAAVSH